MSKDKITVSMNIYDIPILVEELEKANNEILRLNNIMDELEKWVKENNLGKYRTENVVNTDELLDKLNELKENK